MSFEGYMQYLCPEGHEFHVGAFEETDNDVCPHCGQLPVWCHTVDQTNGTNPEDPSTFDVPLVIKTHRVMSDPLRILMEAVRLTDGSVVNRMEDLRKLADQLNPKTLQVETYHIPPNTGHKI